MVEIYRPYVEQTAISFEYVTPTEEEFAKRFLAITEQFPWLVWEENGQLLGYAYGSRAFERMAFSWTAEASIYLHPNAKRRGIGRRLYEKLEQLLTEQGYQVVYALITAENAASVAFHRAMGYEVIGQFPRCGYKFDRWYGLVWMEKRLQLIEHPSLPVSIDNVNR